eukprot:GHVH01001212.1.p1 GENE.GHVH01001212.1~~GHVH01001212.1.p1  ORF type:complete len:140 (+),score=19.07 GHVH01001212.1:35-454(+)
MASSRLKADKDGKKQSVKNVIVAAEEKRGRSEGTMLTLIDKEEILVNIVRRRKTLPVDGAKILDGIQRVELEAMLWTLRPRVVSQMRSIDLDKIIGWLTQTSVEHIPVDDIQSWVECQKIASRLDVKLEKLVNSFDSGV